MTAKPKKGRPAGRKPKPGERVPLGLRVTAELKRSLDAAAERSGRSQSQEAEFRLESSFERDQQIEATWGSREIYAISGLLGAAMYDAILPEHRKSPDARLLQSPAAFANAAALVANILHRMKPEGTEFTGAISERLAEALAILAPGANDFISEIRDDPHSFDVRDVKRELGHLPPKDEENRK